ncbi:hypothetical protein JTI58_17125 [Lysinibacillus fusiformis]|nr:hypothetical protein JTI58_17125 [Lysinibacillus fusiformis]
MNVYRNNKDMEQLMKAFCLLRNKKNCENFFHVLCTKQEIKLFSEDH